MTVSIKTDIANPVLFDGSLYLFNATYRIEDTDPGGFTWDYPMTLCETLVTPINNPISASVTLKADALLAMYNSAKGA